MATASTHLTEEQLGEVRCSFCGRRNTVRRIDEKLYFCSHCDKMFQR